MPPGVAVGPASSIASGYAACSVINTSGPQDHQQKALLRGNYPENMDSHVMGIGSSSSSSTSSTSSRSSSSSSGESAELSDKDHFKCSRATKALKHRCTCAARWRTCTRTTRPRRPRRAVAAAVALGTEAHRDPRGAVRQRRDAVAGQAVHPDTAGGARHVLRAVARHHRQPDGVQGVQPGVPHHVPVHRPHASDRAELRLRGRRAPAVVAHRPARVRPGEHTAVRAGRPPVQERAQGAAQAPAARQVAHIQPCCFEHVTNVEASDRSRYLSLQNLVPAAPRTTTTTPDAEIAAAAAAVAVEP